MQQVAQRRHFSDCQFAAFRNDLADAAAIADGRACVYATGSYGRREASSFSDLDLFIVGTTTTVGAGEKRDLNRLDEICIKADLISTIRDHNIPDFDGDGAYLQYYTISDLTTQLGRPDDDALNTFSARLLLLLESTPLIERSVYE